jgi:hypothetical protein
VDKHLAATAEMLRLTGRLKEKEDQHERTVIPDS